MDSGMANTTAVERLRTAFSVQQALNGPENDYLKYLEEAYEKLYADTCLISAELLDHFVELITDEDDTPGKLASKLLKDFAKIREKGFLFIDGSWIQVKGAKIPSKLLQRLGQCPPKMQILLEKDGEEIVFREGIQSGSI